MEFVVVFGWMPIQAVLVSLSENHSLTLVVYPYVLPLSLRVMVVSVLQAWVLEL